MALVRAQVPENPVDHLMIDDERDDPHLALAPGAHQRVGLVHPLDHLGPAPAQRARLLRPKNAGLTEEEILRTTKGPDDPGWSDFDAALLRAADELHHDAILSDATWETLSRRYDEKQMMDVVFTVGQYNLVSWMLNSTGVQLEAGVPGVPEGSEQSPRKRFPISKISSIVTW